MGRDVSISIVAHDKYSTVINTIRTANQNFTKDIDGLEGKLKAFSSQQQPLKRELDELRVKMLEAEKQFKETGDAANETALKLSEDEYVGAKRNYELLRKEIKYTENAMKSLGDVESRANSRVAKKEKSAAGMIGNVVKGVAIQQIGSAFSEAFSAKIGSTFGEEAGTMINSSFSGAISGAALGTMLGTALAPGIGTLIGAGIGGVAGIVQGSTQNFQKEDAYFKENYKSQYERITQTKKSICKPELLLPHSATLIE